MTRSSFRRFGVSSLSAIAAALLSLPAPGAAHPARAAAGFHVVSFKTKITRGARQALQRTGIEIIDYEPVDSYIVWATNAELAQVRQLKAVASVSAFSVERKMSPALTRNDRELSPLQFAVASRATRQATRMFSRVGRLLSAAPLDAEGRLTTLTVRVPYRYLSRLVAAPWVMYVNPAPKGLVLQDEMGTLIVGGSIESGRPVGNYRDWLVEHGLSGRGVIVAVADTGIWDRHPDLQGRVVKTFNYGMPEGTSYDSHSHGTHVAGIVGGAPSGQGPGFDDPDGFAYGHGVAPKVLLVNQNLSPLVRSSESAGDRWLARLAEDAWNAGARIFNASWSTDGGHRAGYVADARRLDELTRNALIGNPGMEEMLFVFAAGNEGEEGPPTPNEAKNIITVGATHAGRGLHWPLESDVDGVPGWSARGPTTDSRVFPMVTAPGAWLPSARPPVHSAPTCTGPVDGLALYCSKSGTSMAAPHVSGAAALIHEWWAREHGGQPSPAMTKALLVNSATDMGESDVPNDIEGWGRINLGDLLSKRVDLADDQTVTFNHPDERKTYTVRIKNKGALKATLAWSDAPAAVGASPALVNDLDLVVKRIHRARTQQVWLGNNFRVGLSVSGGTPDRLNNLENVFVRGAEPGIYEITVRAFNVPGDGVPGNASLTDQDYALVITTARR